MKKEHRSVSLSILALAAAGLLCCSPYFEGECEPVDQPTLLARSFDSPDDQSYVVIEPGDLDVCVAGDSTATATVVFDPNAIETSPPATATVVPCVDLRFPTAVELSSAGAGSALATGYVEKLDFATPCLGSKGYRCAVFGSTPTKNWYVQFNRDTIQIIEGQYGNRGGLETEHRYSMRENGSVRTTSNCMRQVRYDPTPTWW